MPGKVDLQFFEQMQSPERRPVDGTQFIRRKFSENNDTDWQQKTIVYTIHYTYNQ